MKALRSTTTLGHLYGDFIEIHVVKSVQIARIYENFLCDTT